MHALYLNDMGNSRHVKSLCLLGMTCRCGGTNWQSLIGALTWRLFVKSAVVHATAVHAAVAVRVVPCRGHVCMERHARLVPLMQACASPGYDSRASPFQERTG